ncbi:hypothetical protein E2C01_000419 [Portunus trituberculatus]|uniref:C2H2-type domain-containing protein n=1 Tax=Portunus trituberculatus TaxID=210409 RepID=A0A5B7CJQ0_PORTR|nr:hypothetical protein [Portunus trituberculatus]
MRFRCYLCLVAWLSGEGHAAHEARRHCQARPRVEFEAEFKVIPRRDVCGGSSPGCNTFLTGLVLPEAMKEILN